MNYRSPYTVSFACPLEIPPPKFCNVIRKKFMRRKPSKSLPSFFSFQFSIQNVQSSEVEIEDHFKFVSRRECCRLNYFLSQV